MRQFYKKLFIILLFGGVLLFIVLDNGLEIKSVKETMGKKFDGQLWKAQYKQFKQNNPRIGLVPALEREILQKGMDRKAVREFLGLPKTIRENADWYDLGVSAFGVDYETYIIEYSQENKVVDFYIRRG